MNKFVKAISYAGFALFFLASLIFMQAFGPPGELKLPWQPPRHDASISGVGTADEPLYIPHGVIYASQVTQASTSAPTEYDLSNLTLDSDMSYTRDSIGHYKIESDDDAAFPDSTYTYMANIMTGAARTVIFTRATDSTLLLWTLNAAGIGVDAAGKISLEIKGPVPEDD